MSAPPTGHVRVTLVGGHPQRREPTMLLAAAHLERGPRVEQLSGRLDVALVRRVQQPVGELVGVEVVHRVVLFARLALVCAAGGGGRALVDVVVEDGEAVAVILIVCSGE